MISQHGLKAEEEQELRKLHDRLSTDRARRILHVNSEVRRHLRDFFLKEGFYEIPPVIIGPVTDPLNHPVAGTGIEYYGYRYSLTQSMIFHKQIALLSCDKLFAFSPNVRLEPLERRGTGRHLAEFTQLDMEVKGASRNEVIAIAERMYCYVIGHVNATCRSDLEYFRRKLHVPSRPFMRFDFTGAKREYGEEFETVLSFRAADPFFIQDISLNDREFYDREDPERPGILLDMDMIYPEGYGEALSGGEREYELEKIMERIRKKKQNPDQFRYYLAVAGMGLPQSAGFGIGIERLVRFITGIPNIEEATPFPKAIGRFSI